MRRRRVIAGAGLSAGLTLFAAPAAHAAQFEVNDDGDPGDGTCDATCTLRDAIAAANADDTADEIIFAASLSGSTITLTDPNPLSITDPVEITGLGAANLTVAANTDTPTFYLNTDNAGDDVRIGGVTLTGALFSAIENANADLTVTDAVLSGNEADGGYGAIESEGGDVTVLGSTLTANTSEEGGAALEVEGGPASDLVVEDSTISGNESGDVGGGIYAYGLDVTIEDSVISGNDVTTANGGGGGMYAAYASQVEIRNSLISGNSAPSAGGGLLLAYNLAIDIEGSTIEGNSQTNDGGDGIAGGVLVFLTQSAEIVNSTLTGNQAMADDSAGGGLFAYSPVGSVDLTDTTIAGNAASDGGGAYIDDSTDATIRNSIIAGNNGSDDPDLHGDVSARFSLVQTPDAADITNGAPGSILTGVDPQLAALGDNGGPDAGAPGSLLPITTMLPATSSPVIDCGNSAETTDQRGLTRPVDQAGRTNSTASGADGSDMGAVELAATSSSGACANNAPIVNPPDPPPAQPKPKTKCKKKPKKRSASAAAKKKCKKKKKRK